MRRIGSFVVGLVVVGPLALAPSVLVRAATPPAVTNPPAPDGRPFDPRQIPSVPDAEVALEQARAVHDEVVDRLGAIGAERIRLRDETVRLAVDDRQLTERVEIARRRLRVLAVESYVAGGPLSTLEYFADAPSAGELTWRRFMLHASFDSTRDAARDYDRSLAGVDDDLVELALAIDRTESAWEQARAELPLAEAAVVDAELTVLVARHEADHRAGRIVVVSGGDGGPTPDQSGNARGEAWEQLRRCESGGNYAIADRTGWFRGAYQFAVSTWHGLGGFGDPADAPPAEQDYRAQVLYDALGAKPWPVCGRFLIENPPDRSDAPVGLAERLATDDALAGPGVTTPLPSTTSTSTTTVVAPPTSPTTGSTEAPVGP
jgi:hypothetical protein